MDISHKNIDVIFRDNNLLDNFLLLERDATLDETLGKALCSFSIISALWIPEYWNVELSGFNLDIPTNDMIRIQIPADISQPNFNEAAKRIKQEIARFSESGQTWMLRSIQTSLYGWNRLVLPAHVEASNDWQLVDSDNHLRSTYTQHQAELFGGLKSVWLKVSEMNPATHFSLIVEAAGEINLQTSLGIDFFNSEYKNRGTEGSVYNAKFKDWQEANLPLYHSVITSLQGLGWVRISG